MRHVHAKPKGTTAKHAGGGKHGGSGKHHPAHHKVHHKPAHQAVAVHPPAHKPKKRTLSLGEFGCCTAEALAASLRLTGRVVSDHDVLALYLRTAISPGDGASILDTLRAAQAYGLAGSRPVWFGLAELITAEPVILGVDLPGPHSVLAVDGAWRSWGGIYDPCEWPDAVTEEAWIVRWA